MQGKWDPNKLGADMGGGKSVVFLSISAMKTESVVVLGQDSKESKNTRKAYKTFRA